MNAEFSHRDHMMNFWQQNRQQELPSNIEAEQMLLGALIMRTEAISNIPETFHASHFSDEIHQRIYKEIREAFNQGKKSNPVSIKRIFENDFKVGHLSISEYLAALLGSPGTIYELPGLASAVTFCAMQRQVLDLSYQASSLAYAPVDDATFLEEIARLQSALETIKSGIDDGDDVTLATASRSALDNTSEAFRGHGQIGIDYGFKPLMDLIGPAMAGQLIVIGAGTKQGKSSLLEQIVMGSAMNGHPVWIYSGEMKGEELAHRALSRVTDIQAWRQIQGKVSEAEYERLESALRNAQTWQNRVFVKDKPMTMSQIERSVETFSRRNPGGLVIIDHVGLVERDKDTMRMTEQEFGPIVTRRSKLLASRAGVPIFAAAQLKKNTFVNDDRTVTAKTLRSVITRRPKYTDLIGACEKDANHVITPFRPEPILQDMEPLEGTDLYAEWESLMDSVRDTAEIRVALSRHTKFPKSKKVRWNGAKTMFEEIVPMDQGRMF